MSKPTTEGIKAKLRPGERLLWSGKPAYEAGAAQSERRSLLRPVMISVMVLVAGWIVTSQMPEGSDELAAAVEKVVHTIKCGP